MLNTIMKDISDLTRILLSTMKKILLKEHELQTTKLCESPPDFLPST